MIPCAYRFGPHVWTNLESEKIVFHDTVTISHPAHRTVLRLLTPEEEIRECIERRQGGGEWVLELRDKGLLSGSDFGPRFSDHF